MRQKKETAGQMTPIEDGSVYPMATFMGAVGWGRHALSQARKQGLRVVKVSGRNFIRGRDFSEFLGAVSSANAGTESH